MICYNTPPQAFSYDSISFGSFLKIAVPKIGALSLQRIYSFVNIRFLICPKDFVDIFQKILSKLLEHTGFSEKDTEYT